MREEFRQDWDCLLCLHIQLLAVRMVYTRCWALYNMWCLNISTVWWPDVENMNIFISHLSYENDVMLFCRLMFVLYACVYTVYMWNAFDRKVLNEICYLCTEWFLWLSNWLILLYFHSTPFSFSRRSDPQFRQHFQILRYDAKFKLCFRNQKTNIKYCHNYVLIITFAIFFPPFSVCLMVHSLHRMWNFSFHYFSILTVLHLAGNASWEPFSSFAWYNRTLIHKYDTR